MIQRGWILLLYWKQYLPAQWKEDCLTLWTVMLDRIVFHTQHSITEQVSQRQRITMQNVQLLYVCIYVCTCIYLLKVYYV